MLASASRAAERSSGSPAAAAFASAGTVAGELSSASACQAATRTAKCELSLAARTVGSASAPSFRCASITANCDSAGSAAHWRRQASITCGSLNSRTSFAAADRRTASLPESAFVMSSAR